MVLNILNTILIPSASIICITYVSINYLTYTPAMLSMLSSLNISLIYSILFRIILGIIVFLSLSMLLNILADLYRFFIFQRLKTLLSSILDSNRCKPFFRLVYVYMAFVLTLRYYFRKERVWIIYSIGIIMFIIIYTNIISIPVYIGLLIYLGLSLIAYDNIGELLTNYLSTNASSQFTLGFATFLISMDNNTHTIIRSVSRWVNAATMIIGKTPMTATGRATLLIGTTSGIMLGINEELNRRSHERMNDKTVAAQREATAVQDRGISVQDAAAAETARLKRIELAIQKPNLASVIFDGYPDEYEKFVNAQASQFSKSKYTPGQIKYAETSWWTRRK